MRRASLLKWIFVGVIAFAASPAFAEISDAGLLDDVTQRFLTQSSTWGIVITRYASWLFWLLATISMVWTFGMMALRKADIGEFFAEFIRFTVTTGFFWWLLSNGPRMAMDIVNSMRKIGAIAGNIPNALTPSTPISIGFNIVGKAFTGLSWVHPVDNLGILLVSLAIVLCMAIVAANVLYALVTAWTMAYAGTFILGFGGARWTSDLAIGYFKTMLGIGLELMTVTLLIGIATSTIDGFYKELDASSNYELLLVFCVCAILALLVDKIPGRVAALAGGGSGAGVGAGTVIGAAAMAAAAAGIAGAALSSGATNIAGGAQALMAAFAKATASESAGGGGGDLMAAAGSGGGSDGGDSGGGSPLATAMGDAGGGSSGGSPQSSGASGRSDESSGGAFAAAGATVAKVGRVAAGTAANLAKGSWDVAKAKANDMKTATMERISETTGGKIATAIKARDAESDSSASTDNSAAESNKPADADSEVAAFRDRDSKAS